MASSRRIVAGDVANHYSFVTTLTEDLTNPCTGEPFTSNDRHAVLLAHIDLQTQTYTLQIEHVSSECK